MQVQKRKSWLIPAAIASVSLVLAVLVYSFAQSIHALVSPLRYGVEWRGDVLPNLVYLVVVAVVLFFGLQMLLTLRENKTPFISQNVRRLKTAGILLVALEPVQVLIQAVCNHYRPAVDEMRTVWIRWTGGIYIAVGVVVLCMAVVFARGVEMQKQWDETL